MLCAGLYRGLYKKGVNYLGDINQGGGRSFPQTPLYLDKENHLYLDKVYKQHFSQVNTKHSLSQIRTVTCNIMVALFTNNSLSIFAPPPSYIVNRRHKGQKW